MNWMLRLKGLLYCMRYHLAMSCCESLYFLVLQAVVWCLTISLPLLSEKPINPRTYCHIFVKETDFITSWPPNTVRLWCLKKWRLDIEEIVKIDFSTLKIRELEQGPLCSQLFNISGIFLIENPPKNDDRRRQHILSGFCLEWHLVLSLPWV